MDASSNTARSDRPWHHREFRIKFLFRFVLIVTGISCMSGFGYKREILSLPLAVDLAMLSLIFIGSLFLILDLLFSMFMPKRQLEKDIGLAYDPSFSYESHNRFLPLLLAVVLGFASGYSIIGLWGWHQEEQAIKSIGAGKRTKTLIPGDVLRPGEEVLTVSRYWGMVAPQHLPDEWRKRGSGPAWFVNVLPSRFAQFFARIHAIHVVGADIADARFDNLNKLENLSLNYCHIVQLDGMVHCTSLRRLSLRGSRISDLGFVSGLASLSVLDLYRARIEEGDLSSLGSLSNLERLNLSRTSIEDLTSLGSLRRLKWLDLEMNTKVTDIGPLRNLTELQHLAVRGGTVSDVSPLGNLANLEKLILPCSQISDISPLAGLVKLRLLDLRNNQISDLSPLFGLRSLEELDLSSNQFSDLSPLSGLTSVTMLTLADNNISDLKALATLVNLQWLNLNGNRISDIGVLAEMIELRILNLSNNIVQDISPLAELSKIGPIDKGRGPVASFGVPRLPGLTGNRIAPEGATHLDLSDNQISDISPLFGPRRSAALGHIPSVRIRGGIDLRDNPLSAQAHDIHIPMLKRQIRILVNSRE